MASPGQHPHPMMLRVFTCLSLLLNALLLAVLIWNGNTRSPNPSPVPAEPEASPAVFARDSVDPAATQATATLSAAVQIPSSFHWSSVASPDFFIYRDQLHAVGCPRSTLRTVIRTEIESLYADRIERLIVPYSQRFWKTLSSALEENQEIEEVGDRLQTLNQEKQSLIRDVLGDEAENDPTPSATLSASQQQLVSHIPPEIHAAYQAILESAQLQRRQAGEQARNENRKVTQEEYRLINQTRDTALQRLMTPEEWEEYRLRRSNHSRSAALRWLDLDETEFKEAVRLLIAADEARKPQLADQKTLMERYGLHETSSSVAGERTLSERYGMTATPPETTVEPLQSLLGEERHAEYERAQSPNYRRTRQIIDRHELPPQLAADVFDMSEAAQKEVKRIQSDSSLSTVERQTELAALKQATEQALEGTLGTDAYDTWFRYQGSWLKSLPTP